MKVELKWSSWCVSCDQRTNDKRGASFEFPVTGRQRLVVGSYGSASIVCDVIINELNLTCAFLSPLYSFELITPRVSFIISIPSSPLTVYQVTRAHKPVPEQPTLPSTVTAISIDVQDDSSQFIIFDEDDDCYLYTIYQCRSYNHITATLADKFGIIILCQKYFVVPNTLS